MKERIFRGCCCVLTVFVLVGILSDNSWASEPKYPSRTIELFNPFAAGGVTDFLTRFLAKKMESLLGVTVVPQYKPGGGGLVLASYIANARPDGYTVGVLVPENIIGPVLRGQASYSVDDFYIIGEIAINSGAFCVPPDSPWKTFQELFDHARKNPGVKYGHPGIGSTIFLRAENVNRTSKMGMTHVPFKGEAEVITALLGKHIPVGLISTRGAKTQADGGKLRILFSFDPASKVGLSPNLPDIRTVFGNVTDIVSCFILAVSKKTPPEAIQVLETTWKKVVNDPEFVNNLKSIYLGVGSVDGKTIMEKLPERMSVVKEMLEYTGQLK